MSITIVLIDDVPSHMVLTHLTKLIDKHSLPICLSPVMVKQTNQKTLKYLHCERDERVVLMIEKSQVVLSAYQDDALSKSHLNWQSLTHRIVNAGRKHELILQACKPSRNMSVLDATAGFGHDGLIMASTGACVTMLEKQPLMALLLLYEYDIMQENVNWQKLLSRINIVWGDFCAINTNLEVDMIYLDPMFPSHSYHAKVGKNMQILHTLAPPPTAEEEQWLFARAKCHQGTKLIVKRPISAPYLAQQIPTQSFSNDALRFDVYE